MADNSAAQKAASWVVWMADCSAVRLVDLMAATWAVAMAAWMVANLAGMMAESWAGQTVARSAEH